METVTKTTSKRRKTFGQQERYEHVTKAIFNENLKCKDDTWLRNIDITTEEPWLVKKVRRIIEKRMCQTYHKQHKEVFHEHGNQSRHNMKRAVSYELYGTLHIGSASMILIQGKLCLRKRLATIQLRKQRSLLSSW